MQEVGLFEAKTHLSKLVKQASAGEEIIITQRGKPMAKLVPIHPVGRTEEQKARIQAAIDGLIATRDRLSTGGLGWKALRDEGRR